MKSILIILYAKSKILSSNFTDKRFPVRALEILKIIVPLHTSESSSTLFLTDTWQQLHSLQQQNLPKRS